MFAKIGENYRSQVGPEPTSLDWYINVLPLHYWGHRAFELSRHYWLTEQCIVQIKPVNAGLASAGSWYMRVAILVSSPSGNCDASDQQFEGYENLRVALM